MINTIRIEDSYDFISSESALFDLDDLYDDIKSGLEKSDLISDTVDTYMSLEADGDFIDTIIQAAKAIANHIWKMIKFILNSIKRAFLIISRHITARKYIDNMKTIGDVYDFLARYTKNDDAYVSLARWVKVFDNQFMWIHLGTLFTSTMVYVRDNEAKANYIYINEFLDKEEASRSHGEYVKELYTIVDYTRDMCRAITKDIIEKRDKFMLEATGSSDGYYYQLDNDDWAKLRDIAYSVDPRLESVKSFVKTIDATIDKAIEKTSDRMDRIMKEIEAFEQEIRFGGYSANAEREIRERYKDLHSSYKMMKSMIDSFDTTRDTYVKGIHSHVDKKLGEHFPLGFQMVLKYADSALKHIIDSLREIYRKEGKAIQDSFDELKEQAATIASAKASGKSVFAATGKIALNTAATANKGLTKEEQYKQMMNAKPTGPRPHHPHQYQPESIMFELLFTPNMIPTPTFDVNSYNYSEPLYESTYLEDLICESGYLGTTMPYSYAMEEVGLDIRNDSDFKSFKSQSVGSPNITFVGDTDKSHPITHDRMTKRRAMIITSIKLMIEAFNSMRDSLKETVYRTRTNLDFYSDSISDKHDISVEIPATLVKSIYSHNYNKIIELMADSEVIKINGEIYTDKIDVKELDRRLTSLVRNRNVFLSKKKVTVNLDDILKTLRGKLAAFECILAKATIKPLATKIPTTEDLEAYQTYLMNLISLLKTDIIGTVIACNNITMDLEV